MATAESKINDDSYKESVFPLALAAALAALARRKRLQKPLNESNPKRLLKPLTRQHWPGVVNLDYVAGVRVVASSG